MTTLEMTAAAEVLGRAAFKNGAGRSPALDKDLMDLLGGTGRDASIPVLTAWLAGWDAANLAE